MQGECAEILIKKLLEVKEGNSRALSQVWGPPEHRAPEERRPQAHEAGPARHFRLPS